MNEFLLTPGEPEVSAQPTKRWLLAALLIFNLLLRCWVALRPLEFTDGITIPDDTYLSLTVARNLAAGRGLTYEGEPTSGIQPMMVLLLAPAFLLAPGDPGIPVHVAAIASSLFDTLTLGVIARMILRRCRWPLAVVPAALSWTCSPVGIRTATNGMETSLACLFAALAISMLDRWIAEGAPAGRPARFLRLGLLLGAGMTARIDVSLLALLALAVPTCLRLRELRAAVRPVLLTAGGAILAYLPWYTYVLLATGDLMPVSGRAVRLMSLSVVDFSPTLGSWYSLMLREGLRAIATSNGTALAVAGLAAAFVLFRSHRPARSLWGGLAWLAPAWAYGALLFAAYTLYVFGPWFFDRYLFPLTLPVTLTLGIVTGAVCSRLARRACISVAIGCMTLAIVVTDLANPGFLKMVASVDTTSAGYMNAGLWARRTFPPGTVIGSAQSGAIGYFADELRVVNLDGVVSSSCYRALLEFRLLDYCRKRGVRYIVGWYSNFQYLEHQSAGMTPGDLGVPARIPGFRSWGYDWYVATVRP